jgi:predicted RNA binding protein YcfA (HicA-like mRNA interferase family)
MSTLKLFSGKELIKLLNKHNFEVIRVKGSHHFMKHTDGRTTVIPVHKNETISKGLLSKILRDIELKIEDLK